MNEKLQSFLSGMGSVLDIAPTPLTTQEFDKVRLFHATQRHPLDSFVTVEKEINAAFLKEKEHIEIE